MRRKTPVEPPDAGTVLEDSYARCVQVTQARARNFHYAFLVLPPPQYRGVCALYAFARRADDFSDDEPDAARALANARRWSAALDRILDGGPAEDAILPAVADTVGRFRIPREYLHELIAGTEMDATLRRYATWDECYRYCYRVAGVVGMMTVHVFGFTGPQAVPLAERTGIAFQLTNILRDIKEDAQRDRIYLPLEDLARHGVSEAAVLSGKDSPEFRALVRFEVARAREYYRAAAELLPLIEASCRPALEALVAIYGRLLDEIARRDYDVLSRRVRLSAAQKMRLAGGLAMQAWLKR